MAGRSLLRGPAATALPALVLALTLVLLPSMGSRLVPTAALTTGSPAATVVHLLGDEVVPAPPSFELRTRVVVLDGLAVAALLVTAFGLLGLAAAWHREVLLVAAPALVPAHSSPGRSPPQSLSHR